MSDLNPTEIYRRYQCNELDKLLTVDYLKSIIESSSNEVFRVQSAELLGKMNLDAGEIFEFFEQLITSDLNDQIRLESTKLVINKFLDKGENLLKWFFQNEQSIKSLLEILKLLQKCETKRAEMLISIFETTINDRFSQIHFYNKEILGIGQIERFLGKFQPHLTDVLFYDDLDTIALEKFYDEIKELAEFKLLSKELIVRIMQLISNRYMEEGEAEHDWNKIRISYHHALISSECGLRYNPNDQELLWNYGVACEYLDLNDMGIKTFMHLYKINKRHDEKKYRDLKKKKKRGDRIIEIAKSGPLDYLILLYKKKGQPSRVSWAKEQNMKRKLKFKKLTTRL